MNHKWQVAIYFDYFVGHFVQQKLYSKSSSFFHKNIFLLGVQ